MESATPMRLKEKYVTVGCICYSYLDTEYKTMKKSALIFLASVTVCFTIEVFGQSAHTLFVFVGEKVSVTPFEPDLPKGTLVVDNTFKLSIKSFKRCLANMPLRPMIITESPRFQNLTMYCCTLARIRMVSSAMKNICIQMFTKHVMEDGPVRIRRWITNMI